ncbi:MAG: hypothetical protein IT427_04280 [Pirellulales bacterium]|nr:hypothetical protein [Pirellulales bacterium]
MISKNFCGGNEDVGEVRIFPSAARIFAKQISGSFPGGVRKISAGGSEMDREFTSVYEV